MEHSHNHTYLAILILAGLLCLLPACSLFGENSDAEIDTGADSEAARSFEEHLSEQESDFDNPLYDNEQDGAEVTEKKSDETAFIGNWEATSDRAAYLYGNINLKISAGGTWKGNITGEDFTGTWKYNGTGITIKNDLINYDLFFDEKDILTMRDHDSPEDLIVLTAVKGGK